MRPAPVADKLQDVRRAPTAFLGESGCNAMSATGITRNLTITKLGAAIMAITALTWAAPASASVGSCTYRNLTQGPVPYVARVTTNLTSAAVEGADICDVVSEAVTQVQLRGYDLDAGPRRVEAGVDWALSDHLVYPKGWPHPIGPAYDPYMRVTLRMILSQQAHAMAADGSCTTRYWIKLNEYA